MAHALEVFNGEASFVSARESAWHQLGTVLPETFDAAVALDKARLAGWNVRKEEVFLANGLVVPEKYATVRTHPATGQTEPLGIVGKSYTPIQNEDHVGILNALVDEAGAHFETAGSLHGGRDVFLTMKLPNHLSVGGADDVDVYIAALNNHTGASSFRLLITPVRIVCANTQAAAIEEAKRTFNIRHTTNASKNVEEARNALGLTFKYLEGFEAEAEKLLGQSFSEAQFNALALQLMGDPEEATSKRNETATLKAVEGLTWSFLESPTNEAIRGTKWAAYQAVTEYADWMFPVRGGNDELKRALRTVEGRNDELKLAAWDALVGV